MLTVELSKSGLDVGTISFRGIKPTHAGAIAPATSGRKRLYRCTPTNVVTKSVARRIADKLAFGANSGQEDDFDWHT